MGRWIFDIIGNFFKRFECLLYLAAHNNTQLHILGNSSGDQRPFAKTAYEIQVFSFFFSGKELLIDSGLVFKKTN